MGDPMFCRRCGTKLKAGTSFCTECGGPIADDAAIAAPAENREGGLRWRVEVALLTNRFVVRDVLLGCTATVLISSLFLGGIFAWSGGLSAVKPALYMSGFFGVFMLLVSLLTLGVIFGNRWPLEFTIDPDGVVMNNVSEKAHAIHRMSWILAIITGRPLMAGPGLIAQSREVVAIPWNEVRRVQRYPALGVIAIKGGLLDNVRVYCTSANYGEVAQRVEAAVKQHAPSATFI